MIRIASAVLGMLFLSAANGSEAARQRHVSFDFPNRLACDATLSRPGAGEIE
jgi:hypothetical protein